MKHWIGKIGSNVLFETNLFTIKLIVFQMKHMLMKAYETA